MTHEYFMTKEKLLTCLVNEYPFYPIPRDNFIHLINNFIVFLNQCFQFKKENRCQALGIKATRAVRRAILIAQIRQSYTATFSSLIVYCNRILLRIKQWTNQEGLSIVKDRAFLTVIRKTLKEISSKATSTVTEKELIESALLTLTNIQRTYVSTKTLYLSSPIVSIWWLCNLRDIWCNREASILK